MNKLKTPIHKNMHLFRTVLFEMFLHYLGCPVAYGTVERKVLGKSINDSFPLELFQGQWLKDRNDKGSLLPFWLCSFYIQRGSAEREFYFYFHSATSPGEYMVQTATVHVLISPIFQAINEKGFKTGFQRNFMLLLFE